MYWQVTRSRFAWYGFRVSWGFCSPELIASHHAHEQTVPNPSRSDVNGGSVQREDYRRQTTPLACNNPRRSHLPLVGRFRANSNTQNSRIIVRFGFPSQSLPTGLTFGCPTNRFKALSGEINSSSVASSMWSPPCRKANRCMFSAVRSSTDAECSNR